VGDDGHRDGERGQNQKVAQKTHRAVSKSFGVVPTGKPREP
jgi:hypothetical protein